MLGGAGIRNGMWAESVHTEHRRKGRPYADYARLRSARRGMNLLVYQASTGSNGLVEFLLERPERKLIYYHNITPPKFYEPYDPAAAVVLEWGRLELQQICGTAHGAIANSEYSANELRELGMEDVVVFPPYEDRSASAPSRTHSNWLKRTKRGLDVLFVGRVVPNKGHFHLLRSFAALRAGADLQPRLFVIGSWGHVAYMEAIRTLRDRIGREGIVFPGSVTESALAAHYREADVYLCLSEHEGYCVPLVEAMRAGIPVVAYDAGAVADTMSGAGVLLRTLDPPLVAEVVARVATDESLRAKIIERQFERVAEIDAVPRDELLLTAVRRVLVA